MSSRKITGAVKHKNGREMVGIFQSHQSCTSNKVAKTPEVIKQSKSILEITKKLVRFIALPLLVVTGVGCGDQVSSGIEGVE